MGRGEGVCTIIIISIIEPALDCRISFVHDEAD